MRGRAARVPALLLALLCASVLLGLCLGGTALSPVRLCAVLRARDPGDTTYRILVFTRLPRVWGAVTAGAGLAASGVLIQTVLENPLASPGIVGINTGAGLGVLSVSALLPGMGALLPWAAFGGALLATLVVLAAAACCGFSRLTVILAGFALTTILGAGMNLLLLLYPDAYVGAGTFLAGGLSALTAQQLLLPTAGILLGLLLSLCCCRQLDVLALGGEGARSLGMHVALWRFALLGVAALLAGLVVSFGGLIGFVGLAAPHMARLWTGQSSRRVLPASALLGALLVNTCDLLSRVLFGSYEIPVGILLSMAGGIFFLGMLARSRRSLYD